MPISYRAAQNLIKRNDLEALTLALDQKLNPSLANENGWTLLMLAAVEGNAAIGELLIARGADLAARNRNGNSALDIATQKQHEPFIQLLNSHL